MLDQLHRSGVYAFEGFRLDPGRRVLSYGGKPVLLRPVLFDVLLHLVLNERQLVSKDALLDAVWDNRSVEESNISQTIFWLRAALKECAGPEAADLIQTARGKGYRFTGVVTWHPGEPAPTPDHGDGAATLNMPTADPERHGGMARSVRLGRYLGLLLLVGCLLAMGVYEARQRSALPLARNQIVLADFENNTGDPAFDRSLASVLRADLAQSPFIDLLPDRVARETLVLMTRPPGAALTAALAQEVCERTNSNVVVSPSIATLGGRYLLTLTATDCTGRHEIVTEKADALGREAVTPALDALIAKVRRGLGEPVASVDRFNVPLIAVRTGSLDALKAYSEGVWLNTHGQPEAAIGPLRHATELDPQFAPAFLSLGAVYNNLMQGSLAEAAIRKGYALRATLDERQKVQAEAYYDNVVSGDLEAEIRALTMGTTLYPHDSAFWTDLANADALVGRYAQSEYAARQAVDVNPQLETAYLALARADLALGRPDEAQSAAARAIKAGVGGAMIHAALLDAALMKNDKTAFDREVAWAERQPEDPTFLQIEGEARLRQGRFAEGFAVLQQLHALAERQGQPDSTMPHRARLLSTLGYTRQASRLLAEARNFSDDDDYILTMAEIGDPATAQNLAAAKARLNPEATLVKFGLVPEVNAVLALRHGRPAEAIAALGPALAYQARNFDVPFLLGRAYLAAGDGRRAEAAFQTVLMHPGWYPESVVFTLSCMGLAHSFALQGNDARARNTDQQCRAAWMGTDADFSEAAKTVRTPFVRANN
jgi:DNA-binding winged helix-turn-helix (wHTH) protein/Flp pilus assembly protein TadD